MSEFDVPDDVLGEMEPIPKTRFDVGSIVSDGTVPGTRVLTPEGWLIQDVVRVKRTGKKTYITIRVRDAEIIGFGDEDFELAVPGKEHT